MTNGELSDREQLYRLSTKRIKQPVKVSAQNLHTKLDRFIIRLVSKAVINKLNNRNRMFQERPVSSRVFTSQVISKVETNFLNQREMNGT